MGLGKSKNWRESNVKHTFVRITPEEALKLLEGNNRNRNISQAHVAKLARSMESGWKINGQSVKVSKTGKIIDGQHRLWACVEAGVSFQTLLVEGLDDDAFDSLGDEKARSAADSFAYNKVKNANAVSSAMTLLWFYLKHGLCQMTNSNLAPTKQELWQLYSDGNEGICEFASRSGKFKKLLMPSAVTFFWYVFDAIDHQRANEFFEQLEYGVGTGKDRELLPIYHLKRRLEQDRDSKKKLPKEHKLALVIKAWNLHMSGTTTRLLRWNSTEEDFPKISKAATA